MQRSIVIAVLLFGVAFPMLSMNTGAQHGVVVQEDAGKPPAHIAERTGSWKAIMLGVGRADAVLQPWGFNKSMSYWDNGWVMPGEWALRTTGALAEAQVFANEWNAVFINGDCRSDVTVKDKGLIMIRGDLTATLTVEPGGPTEVVIGGTVADGGAVKSAGICSIYIGGNVDGELHIVDSHVVWVEGSINGAVQFRGDLNLHVGGDFKGPSQSLGGMSNLRLDVMGFAPQKMLEELARRTSPSFRGSVGWSDVEPGLYSFRTLENQWVVQGVAPPPLPKAATP